MRWDPHRQRVPSSYLAFRENSTTDSEPDWPCLGGRTTLGLQASSFSLPLMELSRCPTKVSERASIQSLTRHLEQELCLALAASPLLPGFSRAPS